MKNKRNLKKKKLIFFALFNTLIGIGVLVILLTAVKQKQNLIIYPNFLKELCHY